MTVTMSLSTQSAKKSQHSVGNRWLYKPNEAKMMFELATVLDTGIGTAISEGYRINDESFIFSSQF